MSNCITIRDATVVFSADEIDISRLKDLVDRVIPLTKCPDGHEDCKGYLAWWYLSSRYDPQPCSFDTSSVTIEFGKGKSPHTWRDFKALILNCIEPFMKGRKSHCFHCYDEGAAGTDYWTIEFGDFKKQLKREEAEFDAWYAKQKR